GPVGLDGIEVAFDDERAVADAGIIVCATLGQRLGIERLVDETVRLGDRPGAANAGAKVMTLVSSMALGADCIEDCDLLRVARTGQVLGHRVAAPSTLGTFLRSFSFGHVRQLDRVLGETLRRAWAAGAGPGDGRLVVDVDSFVGEIFGRKKQGAVFGYTRQRGYHPLLAVRADTGEVLHIRLRKGSANTSRGMHRFCDELLARVQRAGAIGPKLLRADSGFWSNDTFERLERAGWQFSIGVRLQPHVRAAIEQIDDTAWTTLADYPPTSIAQIAETTLGGRRLVVRRVRTLDRQGELLPSWELFPFLTNRTEPLAVVEAEHRQHAVVELAIRDLKDQALAHFPSGRFFANAAWTIIAALAHNVLRWTSVLGLPDRTVRAARTVRRRLLALPGRLTRTARRWTLHLPAGWPWQTAFIEALSRIRALPAAG
ncbi:MAG TPA: IS1380 family transposase, partial [Solirubrobacteraceae bacterium]|nr:IS1380 family transposase [Solirubrobacteraceae bacterium]